MISFEISGHFNYNNNLNSSPIIEFDNSVNPPIYAITDSIETCKIYGHLDIPYNQQTGYYDLNLYDNYSSPPFYNSISNALKVNPYNSPNDFTFLNTGGSGNFGYYSNWAQVGSQPDIYVQNVNFNHFQLCYNDVPLLKLSTVDSLGVLHEINSFYNGSYFPISIDVPNNAPVGVYDVRLWNYDDSSWVLSSYKYHIVQDLNDLNGCIDPLALNYDPLALYDDGSCISCDISNLLTLQHPTDSISCDGFGLVNTSSSYPILSYQWTNLLGTIISTNNYVFGLCNDIYVLTSYDSIGCTATDTFSLGSNYGCTDSLYFEYDPYATIDDGSCISPIIYGCIDPLAYNYDSNANIDDNNCCYLSGCSEPSFFTYDSSAVTTYGGIPDSASANGSYFHFDRRLILDSYVPSTIVSSMIYSEGNGDVTFLLYDSLGVIIDSSTQSLVPGPQRVYLNFNLDVGTGFQLGVHNPSQLGLFRSYNNVNYPYNFGSYASITGSSISPSYYYFYYDIEMISNATVTYNYNFNPYACFFDSSSCITAIAGCTDPSSFNYNINANINDGSCIPFIYGCTDPSAFNYNSYPNTDDGSCLYCDLTNSFFTIPNSPGNCDGLILSTPVSSYSPISYSWNNGNNSNNLTNLCAGLYILTLTDSVGCQIVDSVIMNVTLGCTDSTAENFDPLATYNDGSCFYCNVPSLDSSVFYYTGVMQSFIVPAGVTSVTIEAYGAQGGTGDDGYGYCEGGLGGYSKGDLIVTPGQTLNIYVGGQGSTYSNGNVGGWNGGGLGAQYGTDGGGASDVRINGTSLYDRVLVAGGGGGSAIGSYINQGGSGGGLLGSDGISSSGFIAGGGGTQSSGGAGGSSYYTSDPGIFGVGGGIGEFHNAGGGGGWYGGGNGAAHASAGGGSSYLGGVTNGTTISAVNYGNGLVIIHYGSVISNSGCTDPNADNYDSLALCDDGSCYTCDLNYSSASYSNSPGNCDGSIYLIADSSNYGPVTYLWQLDGIFFDSTVSSFNVQTQFGLCQGIYTVTAIDTNGCSFTENIYIGTSCSDSLTVVLTTCDSFDWDGITYDSTGVYTNIYTNINGCDSIVSLDLTINYTSSSTFSIITCTSYAWDGVTYDSTGLYTNVYTDVNGCDSTVTLDLTILTSFGCMDPLALNYDPSANCDDGSCIYANCTSPKPTGLYAYDVIDTRAKIGWDNMNDPSCMVWKYFVRYREVGTSQWTTKSAGVGNGLCNFGLNTVNKQLLNLTPSTTYEFRMKAFYCGGTSSNYSTPVQFTTADVCPDMTNLTTTTFNGNQAKVRFNWDTTGAYTFARILLRVDTAGSAWQTAGGFGVYYPTLFVNKFGLTPGQSYRAQGRTFCDSNITAYRSPTWTAPIFWTQPGSIREGGGLSINNLDIYPNPSRDVFNITFSSEKQQDLRIRILSVVGAEVYRENRENFIGEYTKQVSLDNYGKGIYFLEIETNNGVINKKLILQ